MISFDLWLLPAKQSTGIGFSIFHDWCQIQIKILGWELMNWEWWKKETSD